MTCLFVCIVCGCERDATSETYLKDLAEWRTARVAALNADDGWLSLVGLFRLNKKELSLGSGSESDVTLPAAFPKDFGTLTIDQDSLFLETTAPFEISDQTQTSALIIPTGQTAPATVVNFKDYQFIIIKRASTYLLRLRDLNRAGDHALDEVPHYAPDAKWAVPAVLLADGRGDTIVVKNIIGLDVTYVSEGTLSFELDGKAYGLAAFGGSETYFVMLSDETTGDETYGGGRYLYVPKVDEHNRTVIDFNRAENPPCVFTEFATCPLPPRENHLALHLLAGEKMLVH